MQFNGELCSINIRNEIAQHEYRKTRYCFGCRSLSWLWLPVGQWIAPVDILRQEMGKGFGGLREQAWDVWQADNDGWNALLEPT